MLVQQIGSCDDAAVDVAVAQIQHALALIVRVWELCAG
jgi:hypothetical protein